MGFGKHKDIWKTAPSTTLNVTFTTLLNTSSEIRFSNFLQVFSNSYYVKVSLKLHSSTLHTPIWKYFPQSLKKNLFQEAELTSLFPGTQLSRLQDVLKQAQV